MNGIELLQDAWAALRKNRNDAVWYVAVSTLLNALYSLCFIYEKNALGSGNTPAWQSEFDLALALVVAALLSLLQAVLFARIGKAMDRPLWKCSGDADAVRRFFTPWFILNLVAVVITNFELQNKDSDDVVATLEFLMMLAYVFFIPVGACIMYWGRLNWRQLPEILAPIAHQFLLALTVMLLGLGEYLIRFLALSLPLLQDNLFSLFLIPGVSSFIECLAFAAMWRVCMLHRDSPYTHDSDTFDF